MYSVEKIKKFLDLANQYIAQKSNEDIIRQNFTVHLKAMFPESPSWINEHVGGGEKKVTINRSDKTSAGFIDNLVGLTPIEYEKDLRVKKIYDEGFKQIKEYMNSLLDSGNKKDLIIGVLSDTVRWYAFRFVEYDTSQQKMKEIELIDSLDCEGATKNDAIKLAHFLQKYLGRLASRPLQVKALTNDFGFESLFSREYIVDMKKVIDVAISERVEYSKMIFKLWNSFSNLTQSENNIDSYKDEFYLLTLSKFVCVNILERKALLSSAEEIKDILRGDFFRRKGYSNLVEFDFFGWINFDNNYLELLIPIIEKVQKNLQVYDFNQPPNEDLFGGMFTQLAKKSKRLILGQEMTPHWVAKKMVEESFGELKDNEMPRYIDMCCGSGVILVEVLLKTIDRISTLDISDKDEVNILQQAIVGFDVDPLAVFLAKINWIIAAQPILSKNIGRKVDIPVYNADSLFAITPVNIIARDESFFELNLSSHKVYMPTFIINEEYSNIFDTIIDKCYYISKEFSFTDIQHEEFGHKLVNVLVRENSLKIDENDRISLQKFVVDLISTITKLNKENQNGIWSFILKNSYRPGLYTNRFNGLISNPPWLTMSKIKNNPYRAILERKVELFDIQPKGSSKLHLEIATVFLLEGINKYLEDDASVLCVLPESILNGQNHDAFRKYNFLFSNVSVYFSLNEIWRIEENTFSNQAIIVKGNKKTKQSEVVTSDDICQRKIYSEKADTFSELHYNYLGNKSAWSESKLVKRKVAIKNANFRQGVDIMERALFFFDISPIKAGIFEINKISAESYMYFLKNDFKKYKNLSIDKCYVEGDLIYKAVLSKLLLPFFISDSIPVVLPIRIVKKEKYAPLSKESLILRNDDYKYMVSKFEQAGVEFKELWEKLNTRNKLTNQNILINKSDGYIVYTGTSGTNVCAAYKKIQEREIIDQTLNWYYTKSEDEALFIVGLLNSEEINKIIKVFQPRGQQGERHIHNLPYETSPKYDPNNAKHEYLVRITKRIIEDLTGKIETNEQFARNLDPNYSSLAVRRRRFKEMIQALPLYRDYEEICQNIYKEYLF
ncbi:hypothetical protein E0L10_11800 [Enterococcus durans]|uniref:hypothetical protein n=1 Tax=Enterococcus durans TaxID=53345 RepID=UPI00142FA77C|nr:hypothetical protein [Enterococcus durans]NJE64779.1 hypothetical protein [Enterococcus durans]